MKTTFYFCPWNKEYVTNYRETEKKHWIVELKNTLGRNTKDESLGSVKEGIFQEYCLYGLLEKENSSTAR
jgi:hypothetical protein